MSESTTTPDEVRAAHEVEPRAQGERLTSMSVGAEMRVYGVESPHSYFADVYALEADRMGSVSRFAQQRLDRYASELGRELQNRSAEGRYVERVLRDQTRQHDADEHERRFAQAVGELRALATGGGGTATASSGGAAFVPPYFLLTEWAMFQGINRTFADCCHVLPLPAFGMQINVPAFSSTAAAAQQTEGSAVTETDPAGALAGGGVVTITGQITLTQQFNDRAFAGNGVTDVLIYNQLQQQLEQNLDVYVINQTITNGGAIAGSATFGTTLANFYQDIAKGREALTDVAGTRMKPTHFFSTSDLYSFVTRQTTTAGAPFLLVQYNENFTPPPTMQNDPTSRNAMKNFTGTVLPGGLLWFTDDNIPATGGNTQFLVSAPEASVLVLEQPSPVLSVFPESGAGNLLMVANLRKYVAVITRHAGGTQAITGAAYPTSAV